ncbi:GNAT family N-acetyltransferase [Bradyrhizobium sp. CCGUVB23]|uniref:GNAT family N-acetyltransferase n=1 Tax=Bradyrhizobium sp. CCGUVB23 TaxID=2949630 RepID=UPI0020B2DD8E|nr:GNAT family N-acetyltransferase [Bradyrhizobium sp. CCGUVB23]MCP3461115.1 GNAT family N-acetyltransferase [Bradyrhizobium sp. CCGUVB23]
MTGSLRIEKLDRNHAIEPFTCGQPELDRFLIRHALQAQQSNSSQTYVAVADQEVIGFYTIVAGEVHHANAPERVVKGMPRHPIPLLVLARLAVHTSMQGRRIGSGLLLDALGRTLQVADVVGIRALAVHAKDDEAAAFYRHFGFVPSPTDPRHLFMIIKDIRLAAGQEP